MSKDIITIEGKQYKKIKNSAITPSYQQVLFENWWYEPVQEKKPEWEILEFQHKNCPDNPDLNWIFNGCGYVTKNNRPCIVVALDEMLNRPYLLIKAVKRLSDGQIFTIGDQIENMGLSAKIIRFEYDVEDNDLLIHGEGHLNSFSNCRIKHLLKYQEPRPFFITEDGKELFNKEDKVYSVCPAKGGTWQICELNAGYLHHSINNFGGYKAWKHFSSPEARDQYILENKPVLSYNDVMNMDHAGNGKYLAITEERLRQEVKSKL